MPRLLAAALTCLAAALLAVGTAFGAVALLNASPEQPNVPLVHFPQREAGDNPQQEPGESPEQGSDDSADSPDEASGGSSAPSEE